MASLNRNERAFAASVRIVRNVGIDNRRRRIWPNNVLGERISEMLNFGLGKRLECDRGFLVEKGSWSRREYFAPPEII